MVISGVLVAIQAIHLTASLGVAEAGNAFSIVPLLGITLFAVLVTTSLANVRRPAVHKRLMLVATASILQAAVARWFVLFMAPPGAVGAPPVVSTTTHPPVAVRYRATRSAGQYFERW